MESRPDGTATHALARIPLFAGLEPAMLDRVAGLGASRRYPAGQIFWHEGDEGDGLLVLEEGSVHITRTGLGGQETVLVIVDAPAAVGELALIDGAPRDAAVTAVRPVTARLIPRTVFLTMLHQNPPLAEGLLVALVGMVRSANTRHARQVGLDVPGRLAAWLLDRAHRDGVPDTGNRVTFPLNRTQGELAAELGTTRSTLNRALVAFQERGFVELQGNVVVLVETHRLMPYTH